MWDGRLCAHSHSYLGRWLAEEDREGLLPLRPSAFSLSFYFTRFWKLDGRGYVYWFEGDERFWGLTCGIAEVFERCFLPIYFGVFAELGPCSMGVNGVVR